MEVSDEDKGEIYQDLVVRSWVRIWPIQRISGEV